MFICIMPKWLQCENCLITKGKLYFSFEVKKSFKTMYYTHTYSTFRAVFLVTFALLFQFCCVFCLKRESKQKRKKEFSFIFSTFWLASSCYCRRYCCSCCLSTLFDWNCNKTLKNLAACKAAKQKTFSSAIEKQNVFVLPSSLHNYETKKWIACALFNFDRRRPRRLCLCSNTLFPTYATINDHKMNKMRKCCNIATLTKRVFVKKKQN